MNILDEAERIALGAVDTRIGVLVATSVAPSPAGKISDVRFWNPATGAYQTTVPTIIAGQTYGVVVYGNNPSAYDMNMYCVVTSKAPDGTTSSKTTGTVRVPAGSTGFWEVQWASAKVGNYTVDIVLYADWAG